MHACKNGCIWFSLTFHLFYSFWFFKNHLLCWISILAFFFLHLVIRNVHFVNGDCDRQNNAPPPPPPEKCQPLIKCYPIKKRGICKYNVKDLEMERLSCIIWVSPKHNWISLSKTKTVKDFTRERGVGERAQRQCNHWGSKWDDVATVQGILAASRSWKMEETDPPRAPLEGMLPSRCHDSCLVKRALRTVID